MRAWHVFHESSRRPCQKQTAASNSVRTKNVGKRLTNAEIQNQAETQAYPGDPPRITRRSRDTPIYPQNTNSLPSERGSVAPQIRRWLKHPCQASIRYSWMIWMTWYYINYLLRQNCLSVTRKIPQIPQDYPVTRQDFLHWNLTKLKDWTSYKTTYLILSARTHKLPRISVNPRNYFSATCCIDHSDNRSLCADDREYSSSRLHGLCALRGLVGDSFEAPSIA